MFKNALTTFVILIFLPFNTYGLEATSSEDDRWVFIKEAIVGEQKIFDGTGVLELEAPHRAYDAALVPITVTAKIPQTEEQYISKIYLVVDMNPAPLAGTFEFAPDSGWDSFETRIRINEYTNVRAIAELNTGELYMSKAFVKATGGCSAPAMSDMESALKRLGKMKMSLFGETVPGQSSTVQVMVSHPNNSGMQFDQVSRHYIPAHFVHKLGVSYNDKEIVKIDTNFSLSENPAIRFSFVPERNGKLAAYAIDTKNNRFEHSWAIDLTAQ